MITPRQTRLLRAPALPALRSTIADWICALTPAIARDSFVLVPTHAAAEQLRRTVEDRLCGDGRHAIVWPVLGTRRDLYDELASRLPGQPARLNPFEREVMLAAAARDVAEDGLAPPFQLRPGLVAEMLALYDHIRRLGRGIDDFERNFLDELEREQDTDRGAAKLVQQTRFLAAAYRGYELKVARGGRLDEHAVRDLLAEQPPSRPLQRVMVTTADRIIESGGLWPADYALLTVLPQLASIDIVCTESVLAAGYLERLHAALPDMAEERALAPARALPVLVTPPPVSGGAASTSYRYRDREDELTAVARRLKSERTDHARPLDRSAIIVSRPLPYLYLARDVFADGGIPFEALDTLPLAAEPYAAAVDLVLEAVSTDFTRTSLLALLRSPHFNVAAAAATSGAGLPETSHAMSLSALDVALADARYLGGLPHLEDLIARWTAIAAPASRDERRRQDAVPAARAVLDAVRPLALLAAPRRVPDQIATLCAWLKHFDAPPGASDDTRSRQLRVRAAVLGALVALADACRRHDPSAEADVGLLTAAIRRWLESQTFAASTGEPGLQVVDAQAARYGAFDDVQIVGVVDGDWPERVRRNVLYPASLMAVLEPLPAVADVGRRERDALNGARAAFKDLVLSAGSQVRVSTFTLENDAVVEPSMLLDDIDTYGLQRVIVEEPRLRVSYTEALTLEPPLPQLLPETARAWARARVAFRSLADLSAYRGEAGAWRLPRVSVSRLERYLDCPFRFFSSEVLRLEELPEDEDARTPLERGRFLHELWERFFAEWQQRGHGRVTPEDLPEARLLFEQMAEEALATLTPAEAALERARLLGSAVNAGIAHRVFAMEAERPVRIVERLLEFPLQGEFTFRARTGETRTVSLNAKADRIDLLEDGTIRVIDYKSRLTPDLKQALQLPIYSFCAGERLAGRRGRTWTLAEPLYLSFEGDRPVVPLRLKGRTIDDLVLDAQDRLLQTLDDIAAGTFPPRPAKKSLCGPCSFRAVCRLEIVPAEPELDPDVEDAP